MAEKKTDRIGPITFAQQVRAEGSKVTWTSRAETVQASIMVVVMSILVALFLFFSDSIISLFVGWVTGIN